MTVTYSCSGVHLPNEGDLVVFMDSTEVCVDYEYLKHLQCLEEMDFIARTKEHLFHPRSRGVRIIVGYKALDAYVEADAIARYVKVYGF